MPTSTKPNNISLYNLATRSANNNITLSQQKPNQPSTDSPPAPKQLSPPSLPIDHLFSLSRIARAPAKLTVHVDAKLLSTEMVYFEVNLSTGQRVHVAELVQILLARLNEFIGRLNRPRIAGIESLLCSRDQLVQLKTTANAQINTTSCHILYKPVDVQGHAYVLASVMPDGSEASISDAMFVGNLGQAILSGKVYLKEKVFC